MLNRGHLSKKEGQKMVNEIRYLAHTLKTALSWPYVGIAAQQSKYYKSFIVVVCIKAYPDMFIV